MNTLDFGEPPKNIPNDDPLLSFYNELRNCFPKGLKPGTHTPWRDHVQVIQHRFNLLKKHFGYEINTDEVLKATKAYVASFDGNYAYMRTLKYFIIKRTVADGNVEYVSDLLTYIEMLNDGETDTNADWTSQLK